ncbi:mannitol dehydrogenase family protein [Microbacterium rhizosphaerae]|uniref:Mannitol-1-phosphate 5-dehydrogenase n=1 Tax=Microbacterium rhizosphaerae TaxID=1678237 RepID=A0ABZ0STI2_9MICO|nr:mannitol dehydrogenase family protein [Microbacterium rhizosphaerae]WPR90947.1 mannitol dehydrogenase family protein [Microbacterium rhizosphaerae]
MTAATIQQAYRAQARALRPPARIVHLGLGGFHRAHQAWYTAHAANSSDWGIHAFTGRSRELADRLAAQDGLYTLVTRDAMADRMSIVDSIVRVGTAAEPRAFAAAVADRQTSIVSLTITEPAYGLTANGDLDAATLADIDAIRRRVAPSTAIGRLAAGVMLRRTAHGSPLTLLSCDNIPSNGIVLRQALSAIIEAVDPAATGWLAENVTFPSSSVDRITPHTDATESARVERLAGWIDAVPVVTEPFSDWVIAGDFADGRPAWETAGARFVADVEPWERRKLWLLNGAHTILAAVGLRRGCTTVAEAVSDAAILAVVEGFWDEASRHLPGLQLEQYRADLLQRFANPRIAHRLEQINEHSETKARLRLVPVALAERAAGRSAAGTARALAGWIAGELDRGAADPATLLHRLSPPLAADTSFRHLVEALVADPTGILNGASA